MPIAQHAIDQFLSRYISPAPEFKGVNTAMLWRIIQSNLGILPIFQAELRQCQLEGLAFALYKRRALMYYDMRLGKTLLSLCWASALKQAGLWHGKGLIIVHSPIALDVWENEAKKYSNLTMATVTTDPESFAQALESSADFVLASWSCLQPIFTLSKMNKKKKKPELVPDYETLNIAANAFSLAIVDECHLVKNSDTLRFHIGVALLQKCRYRMLLTGTLFGRNLFDIWAQIYLLDDGRLLGRKFYFFKAAFGVAKLNWFSKRKNFVFDKDKEALLDKWLQSVILSYTREEVHDVNILNGVVGLHLTLEQLKAYEDVIDRIIHMQGEENDVEVKATFIRLRQISSGFLPFIDNSGAERMVHFPNTPKLAWLADLAENMPDDVQVVIFCEFIHSGQLIAEVLQRAKRTHARLYGGTTPAQRATVVKDFQSKKIQFLVANSVSGGMSIDLKGADYVLFYESPCSPIVRAQAQARPMARGERPLMVDDLVCSPVEEKILTFISEGRSLESLIRKSTYRELRVRPEKPTVRRRQKITV